MSIKPTLSGNWKVLQKRIESESSKKRKPDSHSLQPEKRLKRVPINGMKDKRQSTIPPKKISNHYLLKSSKKKKVFTITKDTESSVSLTHWAEKINIPSKTYDLPTKFPEIPNIEHSGDTLGTTHLSGTTTIVGSKSNVGKYIAMDCEMVGVGLDGEQERSALARVSVVNFHGSCVLDVFVKPKERVKDWRTWVSGVQPTDMENALSFEEAQQKVADLINGRILVGHAIKNDLECLLIGHPRINIRDTSRFLPFRRFSKGKTPGLKKLSKEILGIDIQGGPHSSIEDARACMLLYRRHKDEFEKQHAVNFPSSVKLKSKCSESRSKRSKMLK